MKLHLALSAIVIPSVVGFQQLTSQHVAIRPVGKSTTTSVMAINEETDGEAVNQRRSLIKGGVLALAGISYQVLFNPGVANAGLLDDYGTDPSKIQQKEEPKRMASEETKCSGSKSWTIESKNRRESLFEYDNQ